MNNITIKQAADFLKSCGDSYILIHQSPDGDCIGSGYAVKNYLEATGRKAKVLCCDEIPARYSFLLSGKNDDFVPQNVISVDVADKVLFGNLADEYGDKIELSIDHHASNKPFANQTCVDSGAAAACEVLYEVFKAADFEITRQMAICLYTGIATDTGCFQFSNAKARTFQIVSHIMQKYPDINYSKINRQMFAVKTRQRTKMEAMAVENMEAFFDGKCAVISVTLDFLEKMHVDSKDIEGIESIPLQLDTSVIGITIKEREKGFFKISMRGTDGIDVSKICEVFGGGGHVKAAGCAIKGTLEEVKSRILEAVGKAADFS